MEDMEQALAENLRVHRARRRLSQEQLANAAGIAKLTLWNIENGKTVPTLETVAKLADVLGCSIDELLGRA